jgi:hypothetical protein
MASTLVAKLVRPISPKRRAHDLRQRYGLLLACLTVLFVVLGVAPGGPWQDAAITGLSAATLIFALRAGEVTPRVTAGFTVIATMLFVAVAVLAAAGASTEAAARLTSAALVAFAPPAIAIGVVRGLREQGAGVQSILGVLCIYLLMGMVYAFVYDVIDRLGGAPVFTGGISANSPHCMYFSFTTLTTVGYGDVTARSDLGHTVAVSEALIGQIYLVTVVALLVSGFAHSRQRSSGSDGAA